MAAHRADVCPSRLVLNAGIGCIYSGAGAIDVAYRRDAAPANVPLQVFLPAWTRNLMRADLTAQEPGDAVLGISDAELSRYLSARGLAVTWTLRCSQRIGG